MKCLEIFTPETGFALAARLGRLSSLIELSNGRFPACSVDAAPFEIPVSPAVSDTVPMVSADASLHLSPRIALGTWHATLRGNGVVENVRSAICLGFRHIDTASRYANLAEVGEGIRRGLRDARLDRSDLFVTSKLWPDDEERVLDACDEAIAALGVGYLDLYLVHAPPSDDSRLLGVWSKMQCVRAGGRARLIGVSNFSSRQVRLLGGAAGGVSCNQIEIHPALPQAGLIAACRKQGVAVFAHSPLGSPAKGKIDVLGCPGIVEKVFVVMGGGTCQEM